MAYFTAVGTSYQISQTFASAKTISALSNANPALATSTAHGYVDDNEVLYEGGWELANNSVYRVDQQDANSFLFKGLNTLNTNNYPAGTGTGTAKLISSWIEIPQVIGVNTQGGTPKFIDVSPLKLLQSLKLFNGWEASTLTLDIAFDNNLSNWSTLLDISRSTTLVAFKSVKGNGASTYGYGYFVMAEDPQEQSGQVTKVQASLIALGRKISY